MDCPCQSSLKYHACCGKYHLGNLFPPTAEALSRARHSACVLKKTHYIYSTWDESTRPSLDTINLLLLREEGYTNFEVIGKDMGLEHHDIGMVTYTLTTNNQQNTKTQTELGMYKRIGGKWTFYRSEAKL